MLTRFAACGVLLSYSGVTLAQWSDDPMVNLAVAASMSDEGQPKVIATSDGGVYISWFRAVAGDFNVYLQRLAPDGTALWGPGGLLVSDNPMGSSTVDYDLTVDAQDNAFLVFSDIRSGPDLDVYAYLIAPDQTFLWGPDGVAVSDNTGFEPAPVAVVTSDGAYAVVWPDTDAGLLLIQRYDALANPGFPAGGLPIAGSGSPEVPAFHRAAASDNGAVVVSYVRDIASFLSPRHVHAQKIGADGSLLWGPGPVVVSDATSVPIAHQPRILSDNSGGAIIAWHDPRGGDFDAWVQRVGASGSTLWTTNGERVSTDAVNQHLEPAIIHLPTLDEVVVCWDRRNAAQSNRGLSAQRFSAGGTRLWTDTGIELLPLDGVAAGAPRGALVDGDPVFGTIEGSTLLSWRLDSAGSNVWPAAPVTLSNAPGGRFRLQAVAAAGGAVFAWEDNRAGDDIYAQNINADGSLGTTPCPGDLDGSGDTSAGDLAILLAAWGGSGPADLSGDGIVGSADLAALLAAWGPCP